MVSSFRIVSVSSIVGEIWLVKFNAVCLSLRWSSSSGRTIFLTFNSSPTRVLISRMQVRLAVTSRRTVITSGWLAKHGSVNRRTSLEHWNDLLSQSSVRLIQTSTGNVSRRVNNSEEVQRDYAIPSETLVVEILDTLKPRLSVVWSQLER